MADQRIAVGVQPGGTQRDHGVTRLHPVRSQHLIMLDDASGCPGHVVLIAFQQPWMLGRFPADEGDSRHFAAAGDTPDDRGDPLRHHLAARDVVGHEQRFGPTHHNVVYDHAHQVDADGVVSIHRLGDGHLGADPVGTGRQHRTVHPAQGRGVEHSGETAKSAQDFGPPGTLDRRLHQSHRAVASLHVHSGVGIGDAGGAALTGVRALLRLRGHGRVRASEPPIADPIGTPSTSTIPVCRSAASSTSSVPTSVGSLPARTGNSNSSTSLPC